MRERETLERRQGRDVRHRNSSFDDARRERQLNWKKLSNYTDNNGTERSDVQRFGFVPFVAILLIAVWIKTSVSTRDHKSRTARVASFRTSVSVTVVTMTRSHVSKVDKLSAALFCVIIILSLVLCNLLLLLAAILRDAFTTNSQQLSESFASAKSSNSRQPSFSEAYQVVKGIFCGKENFKHKSSRATSWTLPNYTRLRANRSWPPWQLTSCKNFPFEDGVGPSRLPLVSCDVPIKAEEYVASGWTKMVHRAKLLDGRVVALKRVDRDGHDMRLCLKQGGTLNDCYKRSAAKFLRELVFLQHLQHPNIIQVSPVCLFALS